MLVIREKLVHVKSREGRIKRHGTSVSRQPDDVPRSTGVSILSPLVDVIHVVDPELGRLHLLPSRGEPFPLQRVAPVRSVCVVVNVVLPATDGPVNGPAARKGHVLPRQIGEVPQGLGLYSTYAWGKANISLLETKRERFWPEELQLSSCEPTARWEWRKNAWEKVILREGDVQHLKHWMSVKQGKVSVDEKCSEITLRMMRLLRTTVMGTRVLHRFQHLIQTDVGKY